MQEDTTHADLISSQVSTADLYKAFRSYVEHENGLIDQRARSGLTIHGLLLTLYGLLLSKVSGAKPPPRHVDPLNLIERALAEAERNPKLVTAIVGITVALITFLSILAAVLAIRHVDRAWRRLNQSRLSMRGCLSPLRRGH